MAHPRIVAQRHAIAHQRLMAAAHKLAKTHGLKEQAKGLDAVTARDPAFAQMLQAEALADLLEGLSADIPKADKVEVPAEAVGDVTVETVEVIPPHQAAADAEKPIGKDRKKEA